MPWFIEVWENLLSQDKKILRVYPMVTMAGGAEKILHFWDRKSYMRRYMGKQVLLAWLKGIAEDGRHSGRWRDQ